MATVDDRQYVLLQHSIILKSNFSFDTKQFRLFSKVFYMKINITPRPKLDNQAELEFFIKMVTDKNYTIKDTSSFISMLANLLTDNNTAIETEKYLDLYVKNFPNFYDSNLATFILSIYEKYIGAQDGKKKAIELATNIIKTSSTKVSYALSCLLRICKTIENYAYIDKLFEQKPQLKNFNTFDVLYELTFYYQYKNDTDKVEHNIKTIVSSFKENKPVLKTAKTLAIRYGIYEKYEDLFEDAFSNIGKIEKKRYAPKKDKEKIYAEIYDLEYEAMLNSYESALSSAVLADLTQGIAHEFGQPVTNIRYNIQYHTMIFQEQKSDTISKELVLACFKDILLQTERIGSLVSSLSPITSRKSTTHLFNLQDAIEEAFQQERVKLTSLGIKYSIKVTGSGLINFDKIQFNQILTNLIINSIDSIEEKKEISSNNFIGEITIFAEEIPNGYSINFSDNGKGIDKTDRVRMFNPFYTTKAPGKGQGLGLYIISNLLKMHSGIIKLDNNYSTGAKFNIFIPKLKKS